MDPRPLGNTGLMVSPIAFGAFKIGRNEQIKYATGYDLPDDRATEALLNGVLDLGITLLDTAPAYGRSEARIGQFLAHRRDEYILSTKVGERFTEGQSFYDFSEQATRHSIDESLRQLRTDHLDLVLIHSNGEDLQILDHSGVVPALLDARDAGKTRFVGFSGKTVEGATQAMDWADVLMVEYHPDDTSHDVVIQRAREQGVGILVKKALASGSLDAEAAIRFGLEPPGVSSLVIGSLSLQHLETNLHIAAEVRR
jgi:aryl-alcohol dehydrogenase-like predicted oxidoreductase